MCREDGGVLDDMLIYRLAGRDLAGGLQRRQPRQDRRLADGAPARRRASTLDDQSDRTALIAVQGPGRAGTGGAPGAPGRPPRRHRRPRLLHRASPCDGPGGRWIVSRTGYTGEHGYELYLPNADALAVWEELLARGADLGVAPIGLAARDTLRFEVCYCLYGHELAEDITPLEAGIGWAVKLKKDAFVGRDALLAQKAGGRAPPAGLPGAHRPRHRPRRGSRSRPTAARWASSPAAPSARP